MSLEVMTASDPDVWAHIRPGVDSAVLDLSNRTCPVTNLSLPPTPPLIPNHGLRCLIRSHSTTSPSSPMSSQQLYCVLSSQSILLVSSPRMSSRLYRCFKSSAQFRRAATESGTVSVLLRNVSSSRKSREVALRARLRLSLDGDDTRVGLVADGVVDALVLVLGQGGGTLLTAVVAATVLTSLDLNVYHPGNL